jgi:membrane fusion protein, heavy metal efflux system
MNISPVENKIMTNFMKRLFGLIVLAFVATGCNRGAESTGAEETHADAEADENSVALTRDQAEMAGIALGKLEQKQISGTIRVNGVLDVPPQQLISISIPLGGFLKNTTLLQGSRVLKGQVIATVENMDFIQIQQDYLEARNQFELAREDYERQQELAKENVNSQKTLQQSRTTYGNWQARYNALREKLKLINADIASVEQGKVSGTVNIYSPIEGYVTQVNVNIGKFVNPADVLFEIVDTRHLHAELIVFERDVPKLRIGQKVRFTLANESRERMASVYLIGREIAADRTVQIHCHLEESDSELLPGMYLSAIVETGGALVPALPNEAIVDYQGSKFIFVSSRDDQSTSAEKPGLHFTMVPVNVSASELGFTEVSLPDSLVNSEIVIKGGYALISKMKNSEEEHGH